MPVANIAEKICRIFNPLTQMFIFLQNQKPCSKQTNTFTGLLTINYTYGKYLDAYHKVQSLSSLQCNVPNCI